MSATVCLTVDVEDFYEGMDVLGHPVPGPRQVQGDLSLLHQRLSSVGGGPKVTLFVVGSYAPRIASVLAELVADGHEVACHGPDHGVLPTTDVVEWLRSGRRILEDLLQCPVRGVRSPRFDLPAGSSLERYRHDIAEAGYQYVSDAQYLGRSSPVRELPVLRWHRLPLGGGSYQRLVPRRLVSTVVGLGASPVVLYYHSYDFDGSLPGLGSVRSPAMAKQILGRRRIAPIFGHVVQRFGSETCATAAS